MKKNIFVFILIIINIIKVAYSENNEDTIDLSDKNPLVFCLKNVKNFDFEQVKEFILRNQDPEYAIENYPRDELFNFCLEQATKDNF